MTVAMTITALTLRPLRSGLVHQSAQIIGTMPATHRNSQGFRRPSLSIEAPSKGAVGATMKPTYMA